MAFTNLCIHPSSESQAGRADAQRRLDAGVVLHRLHDDGKRLEDIRELCARRDLRQAAGLRRLSAGASVDQAHIDLAGQSHDVIKHLPSRRPVFALSSERADLDET